MKDFRKFFDNPMLLFYSLGHRGFFNWMSDERYLKILYKIHMGQTLHLDNPRTLNEKLQWLKLHDRRREYTMMVDKYRVKKYIAQKIGPQYLIPTLGVWNRFDDIDFEKLPDQFVLKCTHDSGGVVVCKDKNRLDINAARKTINKSLRCNYYWGSREWPYKNVKPRIIAEKYMASPGNEALTDYKFMCFNGKMKCLLTVTERFSRGGDRITFFDREWNPLPFEVRHHPKSAQKIEPPKNLSEMIRLSEVLANNITYVRVDFYEVDGKIYFGELTFFPMSGFIGFSPTKWDRILGDWLDLNGSGGNQNHA